MSANVFISFELSNLEQVNSIRALANNPQHELEFHDWSETEPVRNRLGEPLPFQPDKENAKDIREELKGLLDGATKMVVVIGEATHESKWVNWEIQTFYDKKSNLGGNVTRRIMAIYVRGCEGAVLPKRVRRLGILKISWDMTALSRWINMNPSQ